MDRLTRRSALLAAGGSLTACLIPWKAEAAGQKDRWAIEREKALACGLTEAEAESWMLVAQAAARLLDLPILHPMDEQEITQAIHVLQYKLLSRPAYRRYREVSKQMFSGS